MHEDLIMALRKGHKPVAPVVVPLRQRSVRSHYSPNDPVQRRDAQRTVRCNRLLGAFMFCIQEFLLDSKPQRLQFTLALVWCEI